jgi:hypothetical protein
MDARLRNLFSRRRPQKQDQLRLESHPYESTVKQQSPVKGTRPIAGNGPYRLENVALLSQELGAESPNVPRSRQDSYSSRPRTAPQSPQFGPYGRTRSGFSSKAPSTSSRHAYEPSLTSLYSPSTTTQRVRSVSAFSSDTLRPHKQSAHVDILDAATQINPSKQTLIQRRIASGKRDYGEDVADRNIAEFGGDEFPQHDAYSYYTDDAAHSQDEPSQVDELEGRPDSRERLDPPDGTTWGPVSRFENDGDGDDTARLSQRTKSSTSQIYSRANQIPSHSMLPTTANSHARRQSGNSDYGNANGMRGKGQSGRSSSAPTHAGPSVAPMPLPNAITSANLYYMGGDLNHAVSKNKSIQEADSSNQPIQRSKESRGTQTTPPLEPVVAPPVVSIPSLSQQDTNDSNSDAYNPPPISRSRLSRRIILPTPPVSPTTGGSPTASIPRPSLDEDLQPPPSSTQASPASKRHSRGGSASYSPFPHQASGQNVKVSSPTPTVTASKNSSANIRVKDSNRDDLVLESSSEPPRLRDVDDTNNTTDTEIITEQLPGMCHPSHLSPPKSATSLIYSSCRPRARNSEGPPYQGGTRHSRDSRP